ncbi:MAG: DNA repair protein RecO [Syntrophorhabdaceae bacterium]|nr:DNA repair protein RecO [Syntrophorhabdaceae bacterium]
MLHKDEAIVLSKRSYGESDRIVHLYTLHSGKVSAIAKGGNKSQRRFNNTLEPFNHIRVEYFEKQNKGMVRIENADIIETGDGIEKSLKKVSTASLFVEFVERLTKEKERHEEIFYTLKTILREIKEKEFTYRHILHFQLKTLSALGFMPNFLSCVYCGCSVPDQEKTKFSSERGGVLCGECSKHLPNRTYSPDTIKGLIEITRIDASVGGGEAFDNPHQVLERKGDNRFKAEAMEIMEGFITYHLDVRFKSYPILKKLIE